jgi:dTDP-4-dehydrorhamnose reductase
LVTGGGGLLATDVLRAAAEAGMDAIARTRAELDISDPDAVGAELERERPSVVINCAAWSNVEGAEDESEAAMRVNAEAAGALAVAAERIGAAIVYPSSDYVFDGRKRDPYVESDEPNPLSAYARTKLAGERATAAANARHFIVRTAWLYGASGPCFPERMLALAREGAELKVVDDQTGTPTYTLHLARAMVELARTDEFGIHHVAGSTVCTWYELTVALFRQAGVEHSVAPCSSDEFVQRAQRPANSALRSERRAGNLLPALDVGLAEYLAEIEPQA